MKKNSYRAVLYALLSLISVLLVYAFILYRDESSQTGSYDNSIEVELKKAENERAVIYSETFGNSENDKYMVMPSGETIGIYVKADGIMVVDVGTVMNANGESISPCYGVLQTGDYIVGINGNEIDDKKTLIEVVNSCAGNPVEITILRNDIEQVVTVTPVLSDKGSYMLGVWVKDDISGIGTLTFVDENGFAALGHGINDNDTGKLFKICDGAIYKTNLINIVKATSNQPGRLEGMIDYSASNVMGRVEDNDSYGIKGYITKNGASNIVGNEWMPVAEKNEIHMGDAYILSCVSGAPQYYKVEITGIDLSMSAGNKGIELKITDEKLINYTNGIVQGMSGTPIIQDGKLIGAITHVFVNDSTRGYGVFIEEMLK